MTDRQTPPAPAGKHPLPPASETTFRIPTDAQLDALLAERLKRGMPKPAQPMSDARVADVMARLEARGAFKDQPAVVPASQQAVAPQSHVARPTSRASTLALVLGWLGLQAGEGHGARWAMATAAVLAVAVTVVPPPMKEADTGMDTAKDASQLQVGRGPTPAETPMIRTMQPAADAAQLANELTTAGATAITVRVEGQDRIVQATVPDAAASAVGRVLSDWALAPRVPASLEVRLVHLPG